MSLRDQRLRPACNCRPSHSLWVHWCGSCWQLCTQRTAEHKLVHAASYPSSNQVSLLSSFTQENTETTNPVDTSSCKVSQENEASTLDQYLLPRCHSLDPKLVDPQVVDPQVVDPQVVDPHLVDTQGKEWLWSTQRGRKLVRRPRRSSS